MIEHYKLGNDDSNRRKILRSLIRHGTITLAGNRGLKIFGKLNCLSGRRMKETNRVFVKDELAAKAAGYRPCGHCMHQRYLEYLKSIG